MTPQEKRNQRMAERLVRNLKQRNFDAYYCPTREDVINKAKALMPEGSSVTWGGSMTIRDLGLTEALKQGHYDVIDRDSITFAEAERQGRPYEELKKECYLRAFSADFYLSSVNAMSEDGVLVNIDGTGNRVAAITWGPAHVIFVVSLAKVCQTVEAALQRARSTAAPVNAARFDIETPCQKDGVCHNCHSPQSICNYVHFLRNSYPRGRHIVLLTDEQAGY